MDLHTVCLHLTRKTNTAVRPIVAVFKIEVVALDELDYLTQHRIVVFKADNPLLMLRDPLTTAVSDLLEEFEKGRAHVVLESQVELFTSGHL